MNIPWMDKFMKDLPVRQRAEGVDPSAIPFGPPPAERTDLDRPVYWYTDLSDYPNACFDIPYTEGTAEAAQHLTLLYPEDSSVDPLPVLIFVHGGGFRGGNTQNDGRSALYTCEGALHALTHGYAVALVNYRMLPDVELIDMVHDVKTAIAYLRFHAKKLGLDPNRFALIGESAGGYLVNIVGISGDKLSLGFWHNTSVKVNAVVSWYSLFDLDMETLKRFSGNHADLSEWILKTLSPATYIDADTPPFLIQHGTKDNEVDYHNSIHLYEALCAATGEASNTLELVANANHAVRWFISPKNGERIAQWLDAQLKL